MSELSDAYEACLDLAQSHYENFPVASRLLPSRLRPHVAAIYAFARTADDYADEPGRDADERLRLLQEWRRRLVLDAERSGPRDEPVDPRAIEGPGAPVAIGAREARQQLEVDFLRQPAERAVGDAVSRLEKRHRAQMLGDKAQHLPAHVEPVERVDVEAIQDRRGRRHTHRLVIR